MAQVSENVAVGNTATAIFTCPTNEVLTITKLYLTDKSGVTQTAEINIANDGGAASTANKVGADISVLADAGVPVTAVSGLKVASGGKLYVKGSSGSTDLVCHLAGITIEQTRDATAIG